MAAPLNPIDACPRGGFFDGNDDFGGMPFRFLMAMLVASPLIYMAGSGSFWIWCEYRRRSLMNPNSSNNNNSSSYRSMDGSPSSLPLSASSSSASSSSSCNEEEPTSPITSSSIAPIDCASPSADSASSIANPFLRARSAHTEYITRLRSIISTMSYRYRILMMCRLLTRSTTLFKSSLFISCINILINISAIFYSLIEKERCCLGGTGALYSLLCLRICISYLSIRISHWQTNSDSYIPVSDKSCNIGFSIHMLWLSIAFLIATPGDCSLNARIMYGVCCFNILSILVQLIGVVIMSVCIKYCQSSEGGNGGLIIIVCRCILKHLLCGWAYGGPLDQPDPATGIEIEIECLPCIPYGPNVTELVEPLRNMREEERNEMSESKKAKERRVNDLSYHGDMAADGVSRSSCDDDHKAVTDTFSACPNTVVDVNGSLDSSNSNVDRSRCEAGLSCAICLNNYELNEMIRPLPCGHHFHKDCTDTWLRVRSTCPLCVRSVLLL